MLDPLLRRWIDPSLNRAGAWLARRDMSANAFSVAGLDIGLTTVPLLAWGRYEMALLVILLNRLIDGLDGAIARQKGATPFGGYLDIMCDMGFYAAVPIGFALARPDNALWAALLLASFVCTASSFLGRAVLAVQQGEPDDGARGPKSFPVLPLPGGVSLAGRPFRRPLLLDGCCSGFRSQKLISSIIYRSFLMFLLTLDSGLSTFLLVTAPPEGRVPLCESAREINAVLFSTSHEEQPGRYGDRVHAYRIVDRRGRYRIYAFGRHQGLQRVGSGRTGNQLNDCSTTELPGGPANGPPFVLNPH